MFTSGPNTYIDPEKESNIDKVAWKEHLEDWMKSKRIIRKEKSRKIKESGGFMIGEREGAWLVCHWVGEGTRRKGGRPAEFTSEIANMNTNEILNCV